MPNLAAGDVTTQLSLYIAANAAGSDVQPKLQAALATSTSLSTAIEITPMLITWIGR